MAGRVVAAQLVVAKTDDGTPMYFYRGDVLPDSISKESVEHLDGQGMLAKGTAEFTTEPASDTTSPDTSGPDGGSEQPAGNASLEDWQNFAKSSAGATDADLEGKSRNDLRDQFGE